MKTVFNNSEVPHQWAKCDPEMEARNHRGSIHCQGLSLYSYSTEIGCLKVDKNGEFVAFLSDYNHSPTTGQHLSAARSAVSHLITFDAPEAQRGYSMDCSVKAIADLYIEKIEISLSAASRARLYVSQNLERAEAAANKLEQLAEIFKFKLLKRHRLAIEEARNPDLDAQKEKEKIAQAKQAKHIKRQEKARERQNAERVKRAEEDLVVWKEGGRSATGLYQLPVALRLSHEGAIIETSHGAQVNMEDAKNLLSMLKRGADIIGKKIDGFTVRTVSENSIQIGCHKIPMSEIKRVVAAG